jgi:hypothetical protein
MSDASEWQVLLPLVWGSSPRYRPEVPRTRDVQLVELWAVYSSGFIRNHLEVLRELRYG